MVVIRRSLARDYFPQEDPLGRRVAVGADTTWSTVVGVVEDVPARRGPPQPGENR